MSPHQLVQPRQPRRSRATRPSSLLVLAVLAAAASSHGVTAAAAAGPVATAAPGFAAEATPAPEQALRLDARLHALAQQLRCVVCQNQSLADSHAPLALDMKAELRRQLAAGRSDDEVVAHLVDRYGDFVRYRPPLRAATALLWAGPALLLAGGLWLLRRTLRQRAAAPDAAFDTAVNDNDNEVTT
jgi:cytochrome c-type biogenesis protein CcmH